MRVWLDVSNETAFLACSVKLLYRLLPQHLLQCRPKDLGYVAFALFDLHELPKVPSPFLGDVEIVALVLRIDERILDDLVQHPLVEDDVFAL